MSPSSKRTVSCTLLASCRDSIDCAACGRDGPFLSFPVSNYKAGLMALVGLNTLQKRQTEDQLKKSFKPENGADGRSVWQPVGPRAV